MMDECIAQLMSRPESPNLYWALSELPRRQAIFRRSLDGERQWALTSIPNLARVRNGEQLSVEQWKGVFANIQRIMDLESPTGHFELPNVVQATSKETLEMARSEYAAAHGLTAKQIAETDPI